MKTRPSPFFWLHAEVFAHSMYCYIADIFDASVMIRMVHNNVMQTGCSILRGDVVGKKPEDGPGHPRDPLCRGKQWRRAVKHVTFFSERVGEEKGRMNEIQRCGKFGCFAFALFSGHTRNTSPNVWKTLKLFPKVV